MFDLKFYKYIHSLLVNLWENRNWSKIGIGSISKEDVLKFDEQYVLIQNALNEFMQVYPDYMRWLGMYVEGNKPDATKTRVIVYANLKDIKLYKYDY